jgi:transmembrane sensor
MATCETAADIDAAAADWTARIDRGPLLPEEEQDLQAWLSGDMRRLGALARAQALYARVGRVRLTDAKRTVSQVPARWRWARVGALAASLAALTVALVIGFAAPQTVTRRGEVRLVPMPDGSAIMLNTATRISTHFTDAQRQVRLLEGEALFNVAKDPSRPFVVEAGDTRVRAVGTSFSVRRMSDGSIQVLVREGVVEVTRAGGEAASVPVRAIANTKLISHSGDPVQSQLLANAEVARELGWREGQISFDGVSLQQAADEFARYNDTRITFATAAIANRKVTGLFAANDPVGFARAVALSMDLTVDVDLDAEKISLRD